MKKIIFVTSMLSGGGTERVVSLLAEKLAKRNYNVSIVLLHSKRNDYMKDKSIKVVSLSSESKSKTFKIIQRIVKLRNFIRNENPDLIISFDSILNIYTILSNIHTRKPILISERNDPYQFPTNKLIRELRDCLYHFVDYLVFQTKDAQEYFLGKIIEKGVVIPNPIKGDLPYWKDYEHKKNIITASRLNEQKNIPMLIDAYSKIEKKFPDYNLIIFGEGPLKSELEELIKNKKLEHKIFLPGFSKEIHYEMATSSLFVISSNYEGMSNSMLEALAIGIPTISTDSPIGGARAAIQSNQNGILIDVGNTEQLAHEMERIIKNSYLANKLSGNSIKIRKLLNEDTIVNEWVKIIDKF